MFLPFATYTTYNNCIVPLCAKIYRIRHNNAVEAVQNYLCIAWKHTPTASGPQ